MKDTHSNLTAHKPYLKFKHFITVVIMALGCASFNIHAANLPDLGAPDLIEYDQATEKKLGDAFTTALHTQYTLNYDPEVVDYIRRIGHKITGVIGDNRHFSFYVIDNPEINAFAGPNGVIGIHTGLIIAVESEDELASVIAHEIAHVTQRHLSRRYEYQNSTGNLGSIASLIAAVLIGMHDPSAGMATLMGGMGLNIEQQLKNSRQHETEADQHGIGFLHKAGYNPHAMGDFFGRLDKASQFNAFSMPEILRTHPVTAGRLAQAQNRAETLPPFIAPAPNYHLKIIQARLAQAVLNKNTALPNSDLACYQKTLQQLALYNEQKDKDHTDCIITLAYAQPQQPLYANLLFESIVKKPTLYTKELAKHIALGQYMHELHPQNLASMIRYTDLLIQNQQTTLAIQTMLNHIQNNAYGFLTYEKLVQLYQQQQKYNYAYYYSALAQAKIGNLRRTVYLLSQAKKETAKHNNPENTWLNNQIFKFEAENANSLKNIDKDD
ncbi:M48 family metallopeptidase [Thiomicrorhabdus aquaedulcis]|uniref:M48 family metallopeptidase n=1 Tax=Thiomicrorhabdus aquaedulcis TaxID=2211106 RepID=UPI001561E77E|nr:M48 family metalloprotease [Thiomicrorhabdus aquaedulcis]